MTSAPARVAIRRVLVRHALITGVVLVVVALAAAAGAYLSAQHEAVRSAKRISSTLSDAVLTPLAAYDFADQASYRREEVLRHFAPFLASGSVHRIKLWITERDSLRIVVSDEPRLEGDSRPIDRELARDIAAGELVAQRVADDAEHRFEAAEHDGLLEVFIGFTDAAGHAMRLEAYVPADPGAVMGHALGVELPLVLGAVLLLSIAALPLSIAGAARSSRTAAERAALHRFAAAASDRERHELAQRLHDGPIQELAAAGIELEQAALAPRAQALVARSVHQLRRLAGELTPQRWHDGDQVEALTHVIRGLVPLEVTLELRISPDLDLDEASAQLIHRSGRELTRNAIAHGRPRQVVVTVDALSDARVELVVADDGAGFDPQATAGAGHIGLRLIEQSVHDAGGVVVIESAVGQGSRIVVRIPTGR